MVLIAQIALGVIIGLAHAAEPTGTLTLACEAVKETVIGSDVIGDRERVSMGLVVNSLRERSKAFQALHRRHWMLSPKQPPTSPIPLGARMDGCRRVAQAT
jgi:hypothetical protein